MKRKIAAIFAADAVGYSRLVAADEEDALTRLAAARQIMDAIIARMKGRIFNTGGDSVLAEFPSAVDAVRCAIDIQNALKAWNATNGADRRMDFRIGITIGDVVEDGSDLLGDAVNVAARLQSLTEPGSICVSRSVQEAVNNKVGARMLDLGLKHLKNIPEPVRVYAIEQDAPSGAHPRRTNPRKPALMQAALAAGALVAAAGVYAMTRGSSSEPETPSLTAASPAPVESPPAVAGTGPAITAPVPAAPPAAAANPPTAERTAKLDPLAVQKILPRALRDCLNGEIEKVRLDCQLVLDNKLVTGAELASVEMRMGQALRNNRQQDEAILAYGRSISAQPTSEAYNQRGIAYYDKKDWDRAIADYTEAIRLDPRNAEALNNRAWTKYIAGRPSDALTDADAALRIARDKAYIWDTRGHINEALGQKQSAISDYRKAIELDPNLKSSRDNLERLATP